MKVTKCLYCGSSKLTLVNRRSDDNGILQCGNCSIMMVEHISDDYEQLYTAEYFQKAEDNKFGYTDYLSSPVANLLGKYAFARLFAREPGTHLDLGCADGSLMEVFKAEGFTTNGLEISKDAVAIANEKGLDVRFSDLHGFPKLPSKYNVVTAYDLLEHADQPRTVLREVHNNLKDGGYFAFSTLAVDKHDADDYWFNHSLEHYIYYDEQNLTYALADVFGKGNFAYVKVLNNGIAEFWGFAKKGKPGHEQKLIELIKAKSFDKQDLDGAYLLSLFYDQVSEFAASEQIIAACKAAWSQDRAIQAQFYNDYFQGHFEAAVRSAVATKHIMPSTAAVYWQALSDAESELFKIKTAEHATELVKKEEQLAGVRTQLFNLGEELATLKNSRLVSHAITARDRAGQLRHSQSVQLLKGLKPDRQLPHRLFHRTRVVVAPLIPGPVRRSIKKQAVVYRDRMRESTIEYITDTVKAWPAGTPLVSVVIPYYNRHDTIDDTLHSLARQSFQNFEIVIVNDGSTDKLAIKKIKDIEAADQKLQIIHQANQGVATARNNGIAAARGKYVICLDSDDLFDPTFIEKVTLSFETHSDVGVVSSYANYFGAKQESVKHAPYDPLLLYTNNMVISAAAFRRSAWEASGGYKSDIGYEDWEYWINLAEHGYFGKVIEEPLFNYRVAVDSRFVDDRDAHWKNLERIRQLHPNYKKQIKKFLAARKNKVHVVAPQTGLLNLSNPEDFMRTDNGRPNILITTAWMTFGGVETLLYNFCLEIKDQFNISYITGLKSENEWEYKFKEISPYIYHMANLMDDEALKLEFVSSYITTRNIHILHIVHNGFMFDMLPELRQRHPELKVIVTMFNDRVPEYFERSARDEQYIDRFSSDNQNVLTHYAKLLPAGGDKRLTLIPNGVNCYDTFTLQRFDRAAERKELGIAKDEIAVFFIGRLSPEKNPDVLVSVADKLLHGEHASKLRFFIVGDGPMREAIDASIAEVGSDRLSCLGYQSNVPKYLSAADIFVLPSSIEGFPLSLLEAMSMQVVPIASHVGAVPEVIGDDGVGYVISPPGSVKAITTVISDLVANPKTIKELKRNGRKKVEKQYSNSILGKNYTALYKGEL